MHPSTPTTDSSATHTGYAPIYEQFVDDAAFLWHLRAVALSQPHYLPEDLRELEQRIDAQLDGLMTSFELGWAACEQALEIGQPGELFTAAAVAFRSRDPAKIQRVVEMGLANPALHGALIGALGWLPGASVHSWIEKFLNSKDLDHKYLALAACGVRREDPAGYLNKILQREDCRAHPALYARALRLIGELKRRDLLPAVEAARHAEDEIIAFWANVAALLLGQREAAAALRPALLWEGTEQQWALQLVFRSVPVEQARRWLAEMTQDPAQRRTVIKALGILGDPQSVNWLIDKMRDPALSRLAGEAFSLITGIDLAQHQLANDVPDLTEQIPNDDPDDDNVALDPDEYLPWPNCEKVAAVWETYRQRFTPGQRYFLGRPVNAESAGVLADAINNGYQRQRIAAAYEIAVAFPEKTLFSFDGRFSV